MRNRENHAQRAPREALLQELRGLLKSAAQWGEVTLSSGKKSSFYIDGKRVTLSGRGLFLIATLILEEIKNKKIDAIGGLTLGADPIAAAVSCLAQERGRNINAFIVRKDPKKHGTQKMIEGPDLVRGSRVVIVDDVATTGGSIQKAIDETERCGCRVEALFCIVDREEGAKDRFKGYCFKSLFTYKDLQDKPS